MKDIVERLRNPRLSAHRELRETAAREIEQLRRSNAQLQRGAESWMEAALKRGAYIVAQQPADPLIGSGAIKG